MSTSIPASAPQPPTRAPSLAQAILDTVLTRLAALFLVGTGGDTAAARDAARQMLAGCDIQTEEELYLAAEIISFGFHALEALAQAADPDLSLNKKLRLRGSAVSLSREGHKAQRRLDRLQRARHLPETVTEPRSTAKPAAASHPKPAQPNPQPAVVPAQTPTLTPPTVAMPRIEVPPLPVPARPAIPVICLQNPNQDRSFAARLTRDLAAGGARQKLQSQHLNGTR